MAAELAGVDVGEEPQADAPDLFQRKAIRAERGDCPLAPLCIEPRHVQEEPAEDGVEGIDVDPILLHVGDALIEAGGEFIHAFT